MSQYLENLFDLKGETAIVTGSCGQLGKEICKSFLKIEMNVIGVDLDISKNQIEGVNYFELDITNENLVKKFFFEINENFDKISTLVNNAGVSVFEPFDERSSESLDWVFDVNLKGAFFCIKHFARLANLTGVFSRSIVNIASVYGLISPDFRIYNDGDRKNSEIYGATKAGLIQMTKYFSTHLSDNGIRVNSVSPGGIFNPDNPQSEYFISKYSERNPMNRMADVKEIIGAILYLSSKASSYTNGHNLIVDGGMSSW